MVLFGPHIVLSFMQHSRNDIQLLRNWNLLEDHRPVARNLDIFLRFWWHLRKFGGRVKAEHLGCCLFCYLVELLAGSVEGHQLDSN